ncbi:MULTISPECIES: EpsG family protein [unclassified Carboxylicivirga]|uniref:EpsG family protein n=1 Tax=Carboxylicivirga TaxID=1628153 RepID=UPI003D33113E
MDSYRYVLSLEANSMRPFSEVFNIIGGLYSDTTIDIFEPLISFLVSRFTTNAGVYFAVWTAILGFFYLKSINLLYDKYTKQPGLNSLVLLVFFMFILPLTSVSGIRMPTATWIFFYGACQVVLNKDKRFIILALSATLVHWSFVTANVVLLAYVFAGNRDKIYLPIVIASFFVPHFFAPVFETISMSLGGVIQSRYEGYSSEGYIMGMQDNAQTASWFVFLSDDLVFYFLLICISLIRLGYQFQPGIQKREDANLFSFLLVFLSFVNFGKVIPTFGGRYQTVFYLFATVYVFLGSVKRKTGAKINWIILFGLFPMLLYSLMHFRIGSETISAWLFTPLVGSPLIASGLSLAEVLF